tara:strand:- start:2027 stop:2260 length:234 start_codon:yes stop_codon:yes gene_type:complete
MNPIAIMQMAMLYFKLNAGQSSNAKAILKEGLDVITVMSSAMKDNKITMAEKKALVKELKEFSKVAIKTLDDLTIPE